MDVIDDNGRPTTRDIVARKGVEEGLRRANHLLQERVAQRTAELERVNRALREQEDRLHQFIENAPAALAMFDSQMRYLAASRRWVEDYKLHGKELVGRSHYEIFRDIPERWKRAHRRGLTGEVVSCEEDCFERVDGSVQWLRWELRPWLLATGKVGGIVIFTEELTERKRSEQMLQRANRTLQAIRDCHEAMLRATTERHLLHEICRILVRIGGQRMVCVGYARTDRQKTVEPVAAAGLHGTYLAEARITWANRPRGRDPIGRAIRTGKPALCADAQTAPNFLLWRKAAARYGYGSILALPLMAEGNCFGALAICGSKAHGFDPAEQALLREFANELAFGITTLRLRGERERLERELLKSAQREQERIGRDLHDGLCHWLVGAKYHCAYLMSLAKGNSPVLAREAHKLEAMLSTAIAQARDLASDLNPVQLTPASFKAALARLAQHVNDAKGPTCVCQLAYPLGGFEHHVLYHLYRIAQEAVQNALKHARATTICIRIIGVKGRAQLTIEDNGVGLSIPQGRIGMGFTNMRARARLIGARLEIRRLKPGGTRVLCEFGQPS